MISVVIPVLNEAKTIGRCLTRLREQSEPHEIVVVDGGSLDDTKEIEHNIVFKIRDGIVRRHWKE